MFPMITCLLFLDLKADLHYTWIGSESFDEKGNVVVEFNATSTFVINEISGDVFVIGNLDRELVERVKLFVSVEDFGAGKNLFKFVDVLM
jgi:hypothetical protein